VSSLRSLGTDGIENAVSKNSFIVACLFVAPETHLSRRYQAMAVFVSHHVTLFSLYNLYFHRTLVFLVTDQTLVPVAPTLAFLFTIALGNSMPHLQIRYQ
jgi:hypothetical protein